MRRRGKDTGITIACSKRGKRRVPLGYQVADLLMDTIFYMLLIYGCVVGNFVACGAPVHIRVSMLISLILLLITQVALEKRFRTRLVVEIYLMAMVVLLAFFAKNVIAGAIYFASYYSEYLNVYYKANIVISIENLELETSYALTSFQIFIAWILLFASIVFRKIYKKPLVALILAILYFSLYFVVGLTPEAKYLFAFLIGFLPLWIYGKGDDAELGVQAKATTLAGVGVLAILCAVVLPERLYQEHLPDIYSKKREIRSLSEGDLMSSLKYYLSDVTGGSGVFGIKGGLDNGELGNKDELKFDKEADFILTTSTGDKNNNGNEYKLYLRSYIGSNYTNKLWGDLKEEQQEAYHKLTEKYNFDFENQLTATEDLYNQYCFGEGTLPKEVTETITIEKKDIGKKQTLLPYGVIDNVYTKNGNICSDKTYQKRKYSVKMHSDALMEKQDLVETIWLNEQPVVENAITCAVAYQRGENYGYDTTKDFVDDAAGFHKTAGGSRELFEPFYEREHEYRRFVYDNYTSVPEDVAPILRKKLNKCLYTKDDELVEEFGGYWFSPYIPDFEDNTTAYTEYNYMWWCKEAINDLTKYSLAPGKVPEGEDLVDYFLFTNHKGYCSYYATAATVFLRLCGIPTRYVEGYKVVSKDFRAHGKKIHKNGMDGYTLNVTDEYAHAWIEVYIDGCGWMPCDITPARGDLSEGADKENANKTPQNQNSNHTAISPSPKPLIVPSKQPVSRKPVEPAISTGQKPGKGLGYHKLSEVQKLLLFIISMLVVLVVAVMVRHLIIVKKKKKQRGKKNNERVKFYYKELDGMIRAKKKKIKSSDEIRNYVELYAEEFGVFTKEEMYRVISIVEKATFGASEISDYECAKVLLLYDTMRNYLYKNSSFIRKIYYRIWKAF